MKKLWLNEREYVLFSESKNTLLNEIATRKRSVDFYSILKYLPDPDPILRKQGKDIKIYREYLSDPHVWACVQSRKSGVLSLEWTIDRGKAKSKQAEIIENLFCILDLNTIISELLDCVLFGFQPFEIMWKPQGNLVLPTAVTAKPPEWFVFNEENKLKLKTKENPYGEELPDKKFLCPQYNPSYLNPYGERTLSRIFWNITFKKGGVKFWALFTEKYGMPFLVGKHPRGTANEDNGNLAGILQAMIQDAIAVIPDDSSIEIKESVKTSSADVYERLIDKMNAEISKAILGQTLTTEIGNKGSYAASNTHMGVRKDIIEADKKIVERTLNQLIRWICEYNFAELDGKNIPVFSMFEEEEIDLSLLAQRDKTLSELQNIKFTKKYLMKAYGFEEDDIEIQEIENTQKTKSEPAFKEFKKSEFPSEAGGNASFPDQQMIDKFIDSFSDDELQTQAETIFKPVFELIDSSNSYEEIYEKLSEKGLRTAEIEKILQKVIFISESWGQINGLD